MTGLNLFQIEPAGPALVVSVHEGVGSFADTEILGEMAAVAARVRADEARWVVVDFEGVAYFGSSMLEALRSLWSELEARDGRLVLCNLSTVGREIVEVAHFHRVWPIDDSRDQALARVSPHQEHGGADDGGSRMEDRE